MGDEDGLDTLLLFAIDEYGLGLGRVCRWDSERLATRMVEWGILVVCGVVMPYRLRRGDVRCNNGRKNKVEELEVLGLHREGRDPLQLDFIEVKYTNIPIRGACIQGQTIERPIIRSDLHLHVA